MSMNTHHPISSGGSQSILGQSISGNSYTGQSISDEGYMRLALHMAEQTVGQTGTNPAVGCVVVKDGRIVGMGAHLRMGTAHAEVHALNMAGAEAENSTVYVTLEPCSHYGRTPPCCERLAAEKVKRVVVACVDPNPQVAGTGIRYLRDTGIEVTVGVLNNEAHKLNEMFFKYVATKLPFVTMKSAATLDGKIASRTGDSRWVSSDASRDAVHLLRHRHESIMVGAGTVLKDNPSLTTRTQVEGLHPTRVIVDSKLNIPRHSKVLTDGLAPTLLLTTEEAYTERRDAYDFPGVEIVPCGKGPKVDLRIALRLLGERNIGSVLLEGGGKLNGAMLKDGLIDKFVLFIAPKIIGGGSEAPSLFDFEGYPLMEQAVSLQSIDVQRFGDDICIVGYPRRGGDDDFHGNH